MTKKDITLDESFEKAVERASNTDIVFPPDIRLYFYAYYKRALGNHSKKGQHEEIDGAALINGFKMNALFQAKNISIEEAKRKYVELVNEYIPD